MIDGWRSVVTLHPSAQMVGEAMLGVALVAALAFSPRDGVPGDEGAIWPQPGVRLQAISGEGPLLGLALPGLAKIAAVAKDSGVLVSSQALIPTAPPVQLLIPSLNVHRPVEGVGTNRFGVMNLPLNGWNAGWYKAGPVPGAPGDAVIEGHAGYPDQPMLFGKLANLRRGDQIVVVLSDGSKRLFEVVSMSTVAAGAAPRGLAEASGPPRLTLVTCTGHFDPDNKYYSQRLMVEAKYVGPI
jgi:LPXTG-site transpeptidase (sortase) family protein